MQHTRFRNDHAVSTPQLGAARPRAVVVSLGLAALALCACGGEALDADGPDDHLELGSVASALIVPPSDASPPEVVLGVAEVSSGRTASVNDGGGSQTIQLSAKTGPLNFFAAGVDDQSGISSLSIWCDRSITRCDRETCSTTSRGLQGAPCFADARARAAPGQEAPDFSLMLQSLELATQIPQGTPAPGETLSVHLFYRAESENSFGVKSSTPEAEFVWSEVGPMPLASAGEWCGDHSQGQVLACPAGTTCGSRRSPPPPRPWWCILFPFASDCDPVGLMSTDWFCDP